MGELYHLERADARDETETRRQTQRHRDVYSYIWYMTCDAGVIDIDIARHEAKRCINAWSRVLVVY